MASPRAGANDDDASAPDARPPSAAQAALATGREAAWAGRHDAAIEACRQAVQDWSDARRVAAP